VRRRLFWKILFGFWLTFVLIVEGLWLLLTLYGSPPPPDPRALAEAAAPLQVAAAASALERGGRPAYDALLEAWPSVERRRLFLAVGNEGGAPAGWTVLAQQAGPVAEAPEWRVVYALDPAVPRRRRPGPLSIPWEVLVFGGAGGLLFSAALAWYLTRPIERLRRGFERLAAGALDVRLGPAIGRRRDEIADLAHDFDRMATRLQQLVAARDQLLHDVSHELRSPLARLQMALGLARQAPQKVAGSLDRIEAETGRLSALVGELLTLSRLESGVPLREGYFDLQALVASVVADARFEAEASGVAIACDMQAVPAQAPTVRGDAEIIRRAIENLVRNALRYSKRDQGVEVAVRADPVAGCYEILVADSGPGVPPDRLGQIFEPFVRAGDAGGPGFGLGLAIARRSVLAHGGSIEAHNRPSGGLLVAIRLPFGPSGD